MYLITNRSLCGENKYFDSINDSVCNGIENIIIREKDLSNDQLKNVYYKIKSRLKNVNKKYNLIINSNIDVFEEVDADGIHLPFMIFKKSIKDNYAFKENKILGISTHSIKEIEYLEQFKKNNNLNIDYITISHIYETDCKKGISPKGIEILKCAKKISSSKIVALGGITPDNSLNTLKYCDDIAIMSQIMKSANVEKTIKEYFEF
ncbi:thiamine phosphate synthase [Romboutsia lituseburensis]|uniref:Thiamine-phosphate pyrophosphorylase n=1 Tax=Romboutsia lituseburensis DSM 797 TaxID=1121325 RepID=A0A1G9KZP5_9FIRM|nr:thiamine phosphate synthase [Romboutsia lituseburensis]CEH35082.1 Thiamine-phosphate pyrophosphorylase ThiE2 [Romboutsia lituseburensis]SDL54917.1 thiamine-phosphate pyrophosphorylase [Romboutsia lituseburensis DSM 797]